MTTIAEMEELRNSKINETLTRRNKREMENLKKLFITKLEEIQKLKTNVQEQKLLGVNNDTEEWKTQLETCLTKMKLNFG